MTKQIINQNLINKIVEKVLSIKGVASLQNPPIKYSFTSDELTKGIYYTHNKDTENSSLDIFINVYINARIPQIAFNMQEKVKEVLDQYDVEINKINIQIQGIEKWKELMQENF